MTGLLLVVVAISAFLLYSLFSAIRLNLRLAQFKGPRTAAWTDLWYVKVQTSGRPHILLSEQIDKYGDFCRIAPNLLITSDEEFYRRMNSVRSEYAKSDWYKAFKMDGVEDNLLSITDKSKHLELRNRLVGGYAGTGHPHFEDQIDKIVLDVVGLIDTKYISAGNDLKLYDHSDIMQYFTLDVITSLALSKSFGFVTTDSDVHSYMQNMWDNFPIMSFMAAYPPLTRFMSRPIIQRFTAPSIKDRTGLGKVKGVAFAIVKERFAKAKSSTSPEKNAPEDMMDSFVRNGLNEIQIADNVLLQLLAGSETSASILRTSIVHIIANQRVYSRLQAECDEVTKSDVPLSQVISHQRAMQLPYLDACIKESLRYHPAATGVLPRTVPKGGDTTPDGRFLPAGTIIGAAWWNMTRKNKVYGEDCETFRPERWLDSSPEKLEKMSRSLELVFSVGRHRCLGERIAKMEIYKMIFELMKRYDMASLTPMKPIAESINYGIWMQKGMLLRVEKRNVGNV